MKYSTAFNAALKTGAVILREIQPSKKEGSDQLALHFMQEITMPETEGRNKLVSILQKKGNGTNRVTAIMSASPEFCEDNGLEVGKYSEDETIVTGEALFGEEVNIQVIENLTKNPYSTTQTPKINPDSGEVLEYKGDPIFRHTDLKAGNVTHSFLQHDRNEEDSTQQPIASTEAVAEEQTL